MKAAKSSFVFSLALSFVLSGSLCHAFEVEALLADSSTSSNSNTKTHPSPSTSDNTNTTNSPGTTNSTSPTNSPGTTNNTSPTNTTGTANSTTPSPSRSFRLRRGEQPNPSSQSSPISPSSPSSQSSPPTSPSPPIDPSAPAVSAPNLLQPSTPTLDLDTASSPTASPGTGADSSPATSPATSASASTPLQGGITENRKYQGASAIDGLSGRAGVNGPIPTTLGAAVATTDSLPATYQGWLSQAHPQFFLGLSKMSDRELVIVTDKYDQTERTLSDTGFRFTEVDKKDFQNFDLTGVKVLVIDCGPRNLSYQASLKVREFVIKGGYLFTTDWMLDRLNQKFFPGYIAWTGVMNRGRMYDAHIVGEHPALFQHVATHAYWKMDTHCHLIKILRPDAVRVLAKSSQLAGEDGDGVLACVFQYGRGYVLHMTAHFDRSQSANRYSLPDPAPVIGISLRQAIAINFVVAGLEGKQL